MECDHLRLGTARRPLVQGHHKVENIFDVNYHAVYTCLRVNNQLDEVTHGSIIPAHRMTYLLHKVHFKTTDISVLEIERRRKHTYCEAVP